MSPSLFIKYLLAAQLIVSSTYPSSGIAKGVTLATSKSIPPYIIKTTVSGIQLDIIQQAFKNAGHKVDEIIFTSNLRAEKMIKSGVVDAIVNAPNNGKYAHLSEPVIFYQNIAISIKNRQLAINRINDLSPFRLMAFQNAKNYLGSEYAKVTEQSSAYTEVANQLAQLERLYRGQVDVIIMDKRIFHYLNQTAVSQDSMRPEVTYHNVFPPSPRVLGFHDKTLRDQFNVGLKQLKAEQAHLFE